jgi:hypothetical protein
MRGPCKKEEWERTIILIVIIIEGQLLLAMCGIIGVVHIEDNGGRGLRVAGDEVVHQGTRKTIQVCAVPLVLQTRERGGTRSVVLRIQGAPLHPEVEQRVVAEVIGVIGIRIPGGDLIHALGQQVPQGMINRGGVPLAMESSCEALCQANLTVDTP